MIIQCFLFLFWFVSIVESEVVDRNFSNCNKFFFYKKTPPRGFNYHDGLHSICQRYNNTYHFASLYSSIFRIPIYSAYTLRIPHLTADKPARRSKWFIEPQLSNGGTKDMTTESSQFDTYKTMQAINIDYTNTKYDRGHLNPNFYQYGESRTATFTLTNAVPQDPCFNQQMWKDMEKMAKDLMQTHCNFADAERYFVTGAVPSSLRIPSKLHDKVGLPPRDYYRVSVPSVMWTAACCDASNAQDKTKGFSFGYYGRNEPDSWVRLFSVDQLERELSSNYAIEKLKIFTDSCSSQSPTSTMILSKLDVPVERKMALAVERLTVSSMSSVMPAKRKFIGSVTVHLDNDAIASKNWRFADVDFGLLEKRSNIFETRNLFGDFAMATVLSCPNILNTGLPIAGASTELEDGYPFDVPNMEQWSGNTYDEYIVVPASESTLSATTSRCREGHPCDYHNYEFYWCYIDWKNNWDRCCTTPCMFALNTSYTWCYTDHLRNHWAYCSQRSSMISIIGLKCRADHECGLHSEDHYWCYIDTENNWEYCCQPWHKCDNHGSSYNWCYVGRDKESNKQYCNY